MANLYEDLDRYANEFYSRQDLKSGLKAAIKIAAEVGGMLTVVVAAANALTLLSGVLAPLGIVLSAGVAQRLLYMLVRYYPQMGTEERKQLRAVASWVRGGFSLERFIN